MDSKIYKRKKYLFGGNIFRSTILGGVISFSIMFVGWFILVPILIVVTGDRFPNDWVSSGSKILLWFSIIGAIYFAILHPREKRKLNQYEKERLNQKEDKKSSFKKMGDWGTKIDTSRNDQHISVTNDSARVGEGFHLTDEIKLSDGNKVSVHSYFENDGGYLGDDSVSEELSALKKKLNSGNITHKEYQEEIDKIKSRNS